MMKPLGIYLHVPFCLSKCKYCGFYSVAGASEEEWKAYGASLIDDIKEYGRVYGKDYVVDTVFIGGGTPTILPQTLIEDILEAVKQSFPIAPGAEITIESNPKTLTEEKLSAYGRAGINRLSIGLQSFDPDCLKTLGRVHTAEDFLQSFYLARQCGFDNINIDLMFAIPGHTMDIWEDTLKRVVSLAPEHISFYSLQIEEETPFYDMFLTGEIEQIPDRLDRAMYHKAVALLKEAGYEHYEISNCARPGYPCRHNLKYWSMDEYLGIGMGASSYIQGVRFCEGPALEFHQNNFEDDTAEFVFTGLRKCSGIDFDQFKTRYGKEFWQVFGHCRQELEEFFQKGQLIETRQGLRLSETGIDISNAIMAVFV